MAEGHIPGEFELGEVVLNFRWRIAKRRLILAQRHLKTLSAFEINPSLQSWARQHIEWTLHEGASLHPSGVLVIELDAEGKARMRTEAYTLPAWSQSWEQVHAYVCEHAQRAVPGALLWRENSDGILEVMNPGSDMMGATNSLIFDLARTKGVQVELISVSHDEIAALDEPSKYFVVSDEFGLSLGNELNSPTSTIMLRNLYNHLLI